VPRSVAVPVPLRLPSGSSRSRNAQNVSPTSDIFGIDVTLSLSYAVPHTPPCVACVRDYECVLHLFDCVRLAVPTCVYAISLDYWYPWYAGIHGFFSPVSTVRTVKLSVRCATHTFHTYAARFFVYCHIFQTRCLTTFYSFNGINVFDHLRVRFSIKTLSVSAISLINVLMVRNKLIHGWGPVRGIDCTIYHFLSFLFYYQIDSFRLTQLISIHCKVVGN